MTHVTYRRGVLLAVAVALAVCGCKRKGNDAGRAPMWAVNEAEVTAARDAMARGMTAIPLENLTAAHVGSRCVVVARTPDDDSPPPPPLGMVHRMGATTIYAAQIHEVSPQSIKILATYPTSGNQKVVEIPRTDIQSIHVSK